MYEPPAEPDVVLKAGADSVYQCVQQVVQLLTEKVNIDTDIFNVSVCEVGTAGKISDCQREAPGFKHRLGREFSFGRSSFATPSVDKDVKPLV